MKLDRKGLSVLEMMVSMAILGMITLFVFQSYDLGSKSSNINYTEARLQSEARKGFDRMLFELRSSSYNRVTVPAANVLIFRIPQIIDPEGNITRWSGQMEYSLGGTNGDQLLRLDRAADTTDVLANGVTNLQFVKSADPDLLSITMRIAGTSIHGIGLQTNLTGTVDFRNT
ncbi:MAG: prepilin-type N-terminal cleavage/methylation domain-containing protein [Candidatus Omnitrophica bacterium]|nr:prepilin-type N-terminal cleavage/methylation domain-containing protein [Candidatus Omnitrophota bacterium]